MVRVHDDTKAKLDSLGGKDYSLDDVIQILLDNFIDYSERDDKRKKKKRTVTKPMEYENVCPGCGGEIEEDDDTIHCVDCSWSIPLDDDAGDDEEDEEE